MRIIILYFIFLGALEAMAATDSVESIEVKKPTWGTTLSIGQSTGLYRETDASPPLTTSFDASVDYRRGDLANQFGLTGSKLINKDREGDFSSFYYEATTSLYKSSTYNANLRLTQNIPLSKEERKNRFLRYQGKLEGRLSYSPHSAHLFGLKPSITFNVHKFRQGRDGNSNAQYALGISGTYTYLPNDRWYASLELGAQSAFTYQNNRMKDRGIFALAIGRSLTSRLSAELGLTNQQDLFGYTGSDWIFNPVNKELTNVYGALTYVY